MDKILIVNGRNYSTALKRESGDLGEFTYNPKDLLLNASKIKLILFTGGTDVSPEYYGDTSPEKFCYCNPARDREEKRIFDFAMELHIRCIGICRGAQFINVMSGGTMYHDVQGHSNGTHSMTTTRGEVFNVTSSHHQMIIPPRCGKVIGWSTERLSTTYRGYEDKIVPFPKKEVEAVLYPNTECIGVQYHPEWAGENEPHRKWFYTLASDLINTANFNDIIKKYTVKLNVCDNAV